MRVLVTTTGYGGHFMPLVPFARACREAGHEVLVAVPEAQRATVTRAGFGVRACADHPEEEVGRVLAEVARLSQRNGHARMMSEAFGSIATRAVLSDIVRIVEEWRPDLVLRESQEYAGALAAELHGIPHVRVALGLVAQERETLALAAGPVDSVRGELGLPADPAGERLWESPLLTLVPALLEERGADAAAGVHRFRDGDDSPRAPVGRWTGLGDAPLVYLTIGSVAGLLGLFPDFYRRAIDALAAIPVRVLATIGDHADPRELEPLPPNVRVERWVPQAAVLERASAVVCHGGYGSVLGALAHGVPVVGMPMFADDQWRNARRIAELGAGIALGKEEARDGLMFAASGPEVFRALPQAVERVLAEPSYRRAADAVAAAIRTLPPARNAVDLLAAAAGGARTEALTAMASRDARSA